MKCKGEFIFRGIERRDGGNFTNDKGETISYPSSYRVKVDELTLDGVFERVFKVAEKNSQLINDFQTLDNYQKIIITFDVALYGTKVSLVPENVELA